MMLAGSIRGTVTGWRIGPLPVSAGTRGEFRHPTARTASGIPSATTRVRGRHQEGCRGTELVKGGLPEASSEAGL